MPFVTMIAGPNGSGKSTLIARLRENGIDLGEHLNADDIARDLLQAASTGLNANEISLAAQVEVRERRTAALAEKRDHSFETVMSHTSHIDYLSDARATGFTVLLYFVATEDSRINQGRVRNRVLHGGHDVPSDRIIARYHRCLANLPAAIAVANGGVIFDNSDDAAPLRPLAEIEQGSLRSLTGTGVVPAWWRNTLANFG